MDISERQKKFGLGIIVLLVLLVAAAFMFSGSTQDPPEPQPPEENPGLPDYYVTVNDTMDSNPDTIARAMRVAEPHEGKIYLNIEVGDGDGYIVKRTWGNVCAYTQRCSSDEQQRRSTPIHVTSTSDTRPVVELESPTFQATQLKPGDVHENIVYKGGRTVFAINPKFETTEPDISFTNTMVISNNTLSDSEGSIVVDNNNRYKGNVQFTDSHLRGYLPSERAWFLYGGNVQAEYENTYIQREAPDVPDSIELDIDGLTQFATSVDMTSAGEQTRVDIYNGYSVTVDRSDFGYERYYTAPERLKVDRYVLDAGNGSWSITGVSELNANDTQSITLKEGDGTVEIPANFSKLYEGTVLDDEIDVEISQNGDSATIDVYAVVDGERQLLKTVNNADEYYLCNGEPATVKKVNIPFDGTIQPVVDCDEDKNPPQPIEVPELENLSDQHNFQNNPTIQIQSTSPPSEIDVYAIVNGEKILVS